jgi:predicted transcriptional regulator
MQADLPLSQENFRLVRIGGVDAKARSDDFLSLRQLIFANENSYPGIVSWFDKKVSRGLVTGERRALVGLVNDVPVAASILKCGANSKFCHVRIDPTVRGRSLGDLFFSLMALEVHGLAKRVHFTLPEGVWEDRKHFFSTFGFGDVCKAGRQYRLFEPELFSEVSFHKLFEASRQKIPSIFGRLAIGNHSLLTGAVLPIQPIYLEKIFSGIKTVEIRTRFSKKWEGSRVSLYATSPISGLAGEARVSRVIEGNRDRIWEHFGHLAGCSRSEFDAYVRGRDRVYAIVLYDVTRFSDAVPLAQLSYLLGVNLAPPQSYVSLANSDGWLSAVALAAALQGAIRIPKQLAEQGSGHVDLHAIDQACRS